VAQVTIQKNATPATRQVRAFVRPLSENGDSERDCFQRLLTIAGHLLADSAPKRYDADITTCISPNSNSGPMVCVTGDVVDTNQ